MESFVFGSGERVLCDEFCGSVHFFSCGDGVGKFGVAIFAEVSCGFAEGGEVGFSGVCFLGSVECELRPAEGLDSAAMRASEAPLFLIGGFEFFVGVVVLERALRGEDAFAEISECGDASLSFCHSPGFPEPCFVSEEPANGAALEVSFVFCSEDPQRHPVFENHCFVAEFVVVEREEVFDGRAILEERAEAAFTLVFCGFVGDVEPEGGSWRIGDYVCESNFRRECFSGLNARGDAHEAGAGIENFIHHVADHWRVFGAEWSGDWRIWNFFDVLLSPLGGRCFFSGLPASRECVKEFRRLRS